MTVSVRIIHDGGAKAVVVSAEKQGTQVAYKELVKQGEEITIPVYDEVLISISEKEGN